MEPSEDFFEDSTYIDIFHQLLFKGLPTPIKLSGCMKSNNSTFLKRENTFREK